MCLWTRGHVIHRWCGHTVAITVPMLVVAGGDEWRFAANIKLCSNVTV